MSGVQRDATTDPTDLVRTVPLIALILQSPLLKTDTNNNQTPMQIQMDEVLSHCTLMIEFGEPSETYLYIHAP